MVQYRNWVGRIAKKEAKAEATKAEATKEKAVETDKK